jgi:hypothetical protein
MPSNQFDIQDPEGLEIAENCAYLNKVTSPL